MYFFTDDFVSLTNYPNLPKGGTGLVDFIQVTAPAASVPAPIAGAGLPGLILAALAFSAGGDGGRRVPDLKTFPPQISGLLLLIG